MKKPQKSKKQLKLTSPTQLSGANFETAALVFLESKGLSLVYKNWLQPKVGEIDLIMLERIVLDTGKTWLTLVFVEVRVRKTGNYGDAISSITKSKQRKLIKTATHFLQQHQEYANQDCRFDVVGYDVNLSTIHSSAGSLSAATKPEWIQSAFVANAW